MKALCNRPLHLLFVVLFLSIGPLMASAFALDVPPLTGRVNDTAHILSSGSARMLEQTLQTFERSDSTQIVVLTIPGLDGETLKGFSLKVAETWKIGQKGIDNGALLLVAVKDRKVDIEVGYGLEGRLTDLVAGRIIREVIVPDFKKGQYDRGVINGVTAMIAAVKGEYTGRPETRTRSRQDPGGFLVFVIIGLTFIGNIFRRNKPVAAVAGGIFAPLIAFVVAGLSSWWLILLLIPGGILGALIATVLAGTGGGRYGPGGFISGGGGGFSSGGFSGGGGGFGGGGASGGW